MSFNNYKKISQKNAHQKNYVLSMYTILQYNTVTVSASDLRIHTQVLSGG